MDKIKKFIKENKFIVFLFLFSFIIRFITIIVVETPIISDFKMMYDASLELINGTSNYREFSYFLLWGYQMGHVIYQAILLFFINLTIFVSRF